MLSFYCISTGSKANCYILTYNDERLLIDLGVKYSRLLVELGDFNGLQGALVSHQHADHNALNGKIRTSEKLEQVGIRIISPQYVKPNTVHKLGSFTIIPIEHQHDITCYGYLIKVADQIIYFATDMAFLKELKGVKIDHLLAEINYCEYILDQHIQEGATELGTLYQNHHSCERMVEYLKSLKTPPKTVITLHKSNRNLFDKTAVLEWLQGLCERVYVCSNGENYILSEKERFKI